MKLQLVKWFPEWKGFAFIRLDAKKTDLALIYEWCFFVGFREIRKWAQIGEDGKSETDEAI